MPKHEKDAKKSAAKLAKKAEGVVHLAFLVDETGSMRGNEEAVVNGVNEFLHSFREQEADVRVWLAMFDEHPGEPRTRVKIEGKPAAKAKDLKPGDYCPRGMTPLHDAILDTIGAIDEEVGEGERAFVVILTDGHENASEASAETVAKAIKKREKKGWAFLYLGANQQAERVAAGIGLGATGQSVNFLATKGGTRSALRTGRAMAQSYTTSSSAEDYMASAAAMYEETGGKLGEDEDEE